MKKNFKLVLALVLSIMMVLGSVSALAGDPVQGGTYPNYLNTPHTLTISNPDEYVEHTYNAYQIFKGNLNAQENTLADIAWGANVDAAKLIAAIKTDLASTTDTNLQALLTAVSKIESGKESDAASARAIAEVLATFSDTSNVNQSAGSLDEFAEILDTADVLKGTAITFTHDENAHTYTANITGGDGYYFVKDITTTLTDDDEKKSDTKSKFLLTLVRDTTVTAKDTGIKSDKVIVEGTETKNDNDAAIGDEITYKTTLQPVPDPTKYDTFKLEMYDTMEKGLTFTGIDSIVLDGTPLTVGDDYYYYVAFSDDAVTDWTASGITKYEAAYPAVADAVDANAPTTKTQIKIVFKNARALIRGTAADGAAAAHAGANKTLVVNYKATLNKNAEFAPDSNDNTEHFEFTNNPNYDYNGNEILGTDPKGVTPDKTVETYTTTLEIKKEDGENYALDGAVFTIKSEAFNKVLETGEVFIENGRAYKADGSSITAEQYEALTDKTGYTVANGEYYLLKDGSYTLTVPGTIIGDKKVNDTQYQSTTVKYARVAYSKVVEAPVGEGENKTYTVVSGADGYIKLEGVKAGTYTITEIQAPDGYNLLNGSKTITVTWNENTVHGNTTWTSPTDAVKTEKKGGFSDVTTDDGTMDNNGGVYKITIVNQKGATLPSTGGIGTTIFYVAGSILVLAAAILLITKRRMGAED